MVQFYPLGGAMLLNIFKYCVVVIFELLYVNKSGASIGFFLQFCEVGGLVIIHKETLPNVVICHEDLFLFLETSPYFGNML
jgi:hypothetical protein